MNKKYIFSERDISSYKRQISELNETISDIENISSFFTKIEQNSSLEDIFNTFFMIVSRVIKFNYISLYLIDSEELEFNLRCFYPENNIKEKISNIFTTLIDKDFLGFIIHKNGFSIIPGDMIDKNLSDDYKFVCFPMKYNKKIIGIIWGELYDFKITPKLYAYLLVIFRQTSLALGSALYLEKIKEQSHILEKYRKLQERELDSARQVQDNLIKKDFSSLKDIYVDSYYAPYLKLGGDYYDIIVADKDKYIFMIADVSGHGIAASLGTASLKAAFYSSIEKEQYDFEKSVEKFYMAMFATFVKDRYATVFVGELNIKLRELKYISFGHVPAILKNDKQVTLLESNNRFIGIVKQKENICEKIKLSKETSIILFTDGLLEQTDKKFNLYGLERIVKLVKHSKKGMIIRELLKDVNEFRGIQNQNDDIAMMEIGFK